MYDIALSVAAFLKSGTHAVVAWVVDSDGLPDIDPTEAVVFTPGGGQVGSLGGGVLDGKLSDLATRLNVGRLVNVEITEVDALIAELPSAGRARCLVTPADAMPPETWPSALARERFGLVTRLDGEDVVSMEFIDDPESALFEDDRVVSVFSAVPKVVIVGGGPVADSVARLAGYMGWAALVETDATTASGLIAPLSVNDMVVIAAHDLELAGAGLKSALDSSVGYIGSVVSRKMQSDRADWLTYRGVSGLERIHGPAGLDIGADGPEEIAVSIIAEAIAAR